LNFVVHCSYHGSVKSELIVLVFIINVVWYCTDCLTFRYFRTREVLSSYLRLRDLNVQILDFAGQLEEYVSHGLFAQDSDALFCVVADISAPVDIVKRTTSAWFSFLGAISPQKPSVMLVMTHLDLQPESKHEGLISNLWKFLKKNHPNVSVIGCTSVNYRADRIIDSVKSIKSLLYNILKESLKGKFIPKSYIAAKECLQKEFLQKKASRIVSFADAGKVLVRSVSGFHDNQPFLVRVLKFLHSNGTVLYHQSNNFIVLEPYTWLTNILSLFLPEPGQRSIIGHQHGLMKFSDISRHYKLFQCTRAHMLRIMQLLCEYNICIRVPIGQVHSQITCD